MIPYGMFGSKNTSHDPFFVWQFCQERAPNGPNISTTRSPAGYELNVSGCQDHVVSVKMITAFIFAKLWVRKRPRVTCLSGLMCDMENSELFGYELTQRSQLRAHLLTPSGAFDRIAWSSSADWVCSVVTKWKKCVVCSYVTTDTTQSTDDTVWYGRLLFPGARINLQ